MKQFNINIKDEIGVLARISRLLGEAGINIEAICGETQRGGDAIISLIPNNIEQTRELFAKNKIDFTEEEVFLIDMENKPGKLGEETQKLADSGINIFSILTVGKTAEKVTYALSVDTNPEAF
ncbi:MAG: ACT domain-containing protein [archaeon]